jgi:ribosomal protein S2
MTNEKQIQKEFERYEIIRDYFKDNPDRIVVNKNYLYEINKSAKRLFLNFPGVMN